MKAYLYPLPWIEDCIDHIGKAKYVTTLDLLKGYWQTPLTEQSKKLSTFVNSERLYVIDWTPLIRYYTRSQLIFFLMSTT